MAVTLNASTTAGLVQTADTSGVLALQTAGTTAVSISASQVVTLTNALPVASGGSGVTTSTGTGANVLGTSPSISGAVLSSMASSVLTSGTAVASTSGTSIDFTSIPSWVKRITVMFSGVSLSGTANPLIQIGAGSVTTSGYISSGGAVAGAGSTGMVTSTAGFILDSGSAANTISGHMVITLVSSNIWVSSHSAKFSTTFCIFGGGDIALGGTLDRIRITTTNGTDTFDAGTINILFE
jgi:hypothetical protein